MQELTLLLYRLASYTTTNGMDDPAMLALARRHQQFTQHAAHGGHGPQTNSTVTQIVIQHIVHPRQITQA